MITRRGFSLIEAVTSLIILAILSVVIIHWLSNATENYFLGRDQSLGHQKARFVLMKIARELKLISRVPSIDLSQPDQITFTDVDGNTVQYAIANQTLLRNGIALSKPASQLQFRYLQADGQTPATLSNNVHTIQMRVTLDKPYRLTLTPRNLS